MKLYNPKVVFVFFIISLISFLSCSFEDPKAPSWDTVVNLPIGDRTYTMEEILSGNESLFSYDNGLLGYRLEGALDTTKVGARLRLPDITHSFTWGVEEFEIPSLVASIAQFLFAQLTDEAILKNGQTSTVAPFTFQDIDAYQLTNPDFQSAFVLSGIVKLKLKNNLPVPLQNVVVKLIDNYTQQTILRSGVFAGIPANDSIEVAIEFADKQLSDSTMWKMSGESPGSGGRNVPIRSEQDVTLIPILSDLRVRNITAKMPDIDFSWDESFYLDDSVFVQEAKLQSGEITVDFNNHLPVGAKIAFTLDFIRHSKTGQPLGDSLVLGAKTVTRWVLSLKDYVIDFNTTNQEGQQVIPVHIRGKIFGSQDEFIAIRTDNKISMNLNIHDVVFEYLRGTLIEQEILLNPTEETFERPQEIDEINNIKIHDARLWIDLYNTIQMPIRVDGSLVGYNDTGDSVAIKVEQKIQPGNGAEAALTRIGPFTPANSAILDFINLFPTRIVGSGIVWVGDGMTIGAVKVDDYVFAQYVFEAGAKLSWDETLFHADTTTLRIMPEDDNSGSDQSDIQEIDAGMTNRLVSASFYAKVENHLPMGASVLFYFAEDSTRLSEQPGAVLGPIKIDPGVIGSDGAVTQAKEQEITLDLDEEKMNYILQNHTQQPRTVYVLTDIQLHSTNGNPVQIYSSDFIRVQSMAKLVVRVEE